VNGTLTLTLSLKGEGLLALTLTLSLKGEGLLG